MTSTRADVLIDRNTDLSAAHEFALRVDAALDVRAEEDARLEAEWLASSPPGQGRDAAYWDRLNEADELVSFVWPAPVTLAAAPSFKDEEYPF